MAFAEIFSCGTWQIILCGQDNSIFCHLGSHWECRSRCILPACGAGHIIINLEYVTLESQFLQESRSISFPELCSPWQAVGKRELWEQPFQACAIDTIDADWDCAMNQITRIRLFHLLFQNGCSQSSLFSTAGQGERSSRNEIGE